LSWVPTLWWNRSPNTSAATATASAARLSTPAGLNGRTVRASTKFSTSLMPSYHGVNYCAHFGPAAYIARARVVPLRNTGAGHQPDECVFNIARAWKPCR
jgi:hypothetical protein